MATIDTIPTAEFVGWGYLLACNRFLGRFGCVITHDRLARRLDVEMLPGVPTLPPNPVKWFVDSGMLMLVNLAVLHPVGLALSVQFSDSDNHCLGKILDCRSDPEGVTFAQEVMDTLPEKLSSICEHLDNLDEHEGYTTKSLEFSDARVKLFGHRVQGHDSLGAFSEIFPNGAERLGVDWLLERQLGTFTGVLRTRLVETHWEGRVDRGDDKPAVTCWHENGEKKSEEYWVAGERDRGGDKPAVTRWYASGKKRSEEYWAAGEMTRGDDKPAVTRWHENGEKAYETYWAAGELTRGDDKPAVTQWYETGGKWLEEYWVAGELDRGNYKPAVTRWYENGEKAYEAYWVAGELDRRDDKPAVTRWHENGEKAYETYWVAGELDRRDDKPAARGARHGRE